VGGMKSVLVVYWHPTVRIQRRNSAGKWAVCSFFFSLSEAMSSWKLGLLNLPGLKTSLETSTHICSL
jgi:hypothetical protein